MKKLVSILTLISLIISTPASAWYRGGGRSHHPYYGGGYGWGGGYRPNYGAALGIGMGAAILGGLAAGAMSQQYYCQQRPIYDAWGNFLGYSGC